MSDTLWAVIIGGAISAFAGLLPAISGHLFDYWRWRREEKLAYLRERKAEVNTALQKLALMASSYEHAIATNPMARFKTEDALSLYAIPASVNEVLLEFTQTVSHKKGEPVEAMFKLIEVMNHALQDIDDEIEVLLA
jgi:hypothetical protein